LFARFYVDPDPEQRATLNEMSKMTDEQRRELQRLAELPDEEIDTSDIPEVGDFSDAIRGRFYRPIKRQITLRIDADLLEWFRAQGGKYQTRINAALREYVEGHHGRVRKNKDLTP
jgi:uncharacterized protein (DUF4415 family)